MKRVAFITSPSSSHRGGGFYASRLLANLTLQARAYNIEIVEDIDHCDIVHYAFFDLFYHTLPTFLPKPTIISVLDAIPLEFPQIYKVGLRGTLNLSLQKFTLSQARAVITLSHASIHTIHKYLSVPHQKLKLIYLAADSQFKKLPHPHTNFDLPKEFVLYVGGVNYNKNLPALITACRQLATPLVIVGREALGIDKQDLAHPELRHLQGIDWSNVIRLGFVPDMELVNIYNQATLYCQPSFAEGFGLPVLEAMACGTPVVCSNTHSLPEIAGSAALYFDPFSIEDLKTQIQSVLSDKNLRHRLIKSGLDQARKFSWDQTARHTLQLYSQL